MKTIDLKSILTLTFCILGTLFLNTHAFGAGGVSSSELGIDLSQHVTSQKTIYFTNWTAAYHNDPNGPIKVIAECANVIRNSIEIRGYDFYLQVNQSSVLPASGYNWIDWLDGTIICESDMVRLRSVISIGGIDVNSPEPFKLYRNRELVKTDEDGNPLVNYKCFSDRVQYPSIMYMSADYDGIPDGHTNPDGFYALYDTCG